MKRLIKSVAFACGLFAAATTGSNAGVYLVGDSNVIDTRANNAADNEIFFQNLFNGTSILNNSSVNLGITGTTATVTTNIGTVTAGGLAGKDFLVTGFRQTSYSGSELADITNFVNGGGSLFLIGEGNTAFDDTNIAVNSILAAIGSTMRLSTTENFDRANFTNISSLTTSGPLTAGVNSWSTAFASEISLGANGESIIAGIADLNKFGTAVGFDNLGNSAVVPLPAALPLLAGGLGFLAMVRVRRRNHA